LYPKSLNSVHHISGLIEEGFAKLGRPLEVLIHPFHNVRVTDERLDAVIPRLIGDLCRIPFRGKKARGKYEIRRYGRGR
jgi:hypothetical protein